MLGNHQQRKEKDTESQLTSLHASGAERIIGIVVGQNFET